MVVGSSPTATTRYAGVAELADALDLGSSGVIHRSSSLLARTIKIIVVKQDGFLTAWEVAMCKKCRRLQPLVEL